jgi:hypothetical protein
MPQTSRVTDVGRPSPVARVQQARQDRISLTEGSLLDTYERGLS